MSANRIRTAFLAASLLLMSAAVALAKGIDDFSLTKAIPADAFLAIHTRGHEGQAWLKKQYARLAEEMEKQRFDRDFKRLFKKIAQEKGESVEGFDEHWQKVADMLALVDWFKLGEREYAACMKLGMPMPEFISLMRPAEDKVQSNFDGLAGLLKNLASMDANALTLASDTQGDLITHRLSVGGAPFPVVLTLAKFKDTIAVGFGTTLVEQSLAMLSGKEGKSLASTPRFQEAFKKLATPTDSATFIDQRQLFGQLRALIDGVIKMTAEGAPKAGDPGFEEYSKGVKIPGKIFDMMDIFEYTAVSMTTAGQKSTGDAISVLRDDAKDRPLYKVILGNPPLKDPLKFVPKDAGDFMVTSGINLMPAYTAIVKLLKEDIPEGEEALAGLEELKKNGFDLENDLLSWIQGGVITISEPGPTQFAAGEFALMLQVSNEAKCKEQLEKLVKMTEPLLQGNQGSLAEATIEGVTGFRTINHPMLGMMGGGAPTFGVNGGWLIVGSSPKYIEKTLATSKGGDNISKSERFQKEGIQPKGDVVSLSFTDQTKLGEQIGQALQMVPMITMMQPELAKNPVIDAAVSMASKVGRVCRKLDFFQSASTMTVLDGNSLRVTSLQTFREPPPPPKKAEGADAKSESAPKE